RSVEAVEVIVVDHHVVEVGTDRFRLPYLFDGPAVLAVAHVQPAGPLGEGGADQGIALAGTRWLDDAVDPLVPRVIPQDVAVLQVDAAEPLLRDDHDLLDAVDGHALWRAVAVRPRARGPPGRAGLGIVGLDRLVLGATGEHGHQSLHDE